MDYIQCTKCGKTIEKYERHECPMAFHAVLGEVTSLEIIKHDGVIIFTSKKNYESFWDCVGFYCEDGFIRYIHRISFYGDIVARHFA